MKICFRSGMLCCMILIIIMGISKSVLALDKIGVYIDRTAVNLNFAPVVIDGHTLVPMRSIFEALGAQVNWVNETSKVIAKKNDIKIELTIGAQVAYKNGQSISIEVPAQIIDSNTFVPLRFVTETLGYHVYWDGKAQVIFVSTKGEDPELARPEQLSQVKTWKKTFGLGGMDQITDALQTKDGSYLLWGHSYRDKQLFNGITYLIKLDSLGNVMWKKIFEDSWYEVGVLTDNDGYYTFLMDSHDNDVKCIKLDQNGIEQWEKSIMKIKDGYLILKSAVQAHDGGFIVAGDRNGVAWLIKTDNNGALKWEKTYGVRGESYISNEFASIKKDKEGFIIVGSTLVKWGTSSVTTDYDFYIVKVDKQGNVEWKRNIVEPANDQAYSVAITGDGGYLIAGSTTSFGAGCEDAFIVKTNRNGDTEWQKTFGGPGDDRASSVIEIGNREIMFAGTTELFSPGTLNREVYLVKLDRTGSIIFEKSFGADKSDGAKSIAQSIDGGNVIAGYSNSPMTNHGDIYVIKTDPDGNVK